MPNKENLKTFNLKFQSLEELNIAQKSCVSVCCTSISISPIQRILMKLVPFLFRYIYRQTSISSSLRLTRMRWLASQQFVMFNFRFPIVILVDSVNIAEATSTIFRLILRIKNFFLCKFLIPYKFRSHCSLPVLFLSLTLERNQRQFSVTFFIIRFQRTLLMHWTCAD